MADKEKVTPYNNNLFSNHFLEERLKELEDWQEAEIEEEFEKIRELWQEKEQYLQTEPNEDNTQDEWINEVLKIIGHKQWSAEPTKTIGNDRNLNPDYVFFEDFQTRMDASESENEFEQGYVIGEAKKWNRNLDKSTDDHTNPAFQIYNYVDRLRVPWGILTNGRKWRLYSYEDCEADTYYQIDIVNQVLKEDDRETALQNFKYFYLFFRKESFLPKEEGFLDKVFEGSVSYSKGLEEDLEDKIYTALEVTARGFFDTNDIEKTEENVEKVHRASLIFLYRFLFILNAESRGLLPIEEDRYEKILSLEYLKQRLDEGDTEVFNDDEWVWNRRIQPLFEAIDQGEQYGEFEITAYNGGLFDEEKHEFLANHKLKGTYVREVLKLLAQSEDAETGEKVLVDYRDLNIRHLGSVYEGLLEHDLEVAEERLILKNGEWEEASDSSKDFDEVEDDRKVEEGQVYLTNESGERKATGSYYTPEYIVEYIVENTVGPKVEEKIEEAEDDSEVMDNVLELDVCDPAMGSGHFLTEATSFIAHRIVEHGDIDEERVDEGNELVWVKRQVVKRCIYGVDINPLATELAKLSLWIETMSKGKPLSFLDHHLKVGNSLVGSDFDEILQHPFSEEQKSLDNDRFQFGGPEDAKQTLQEKYQEIEEMPEETVEQVHEKEEAYEEFVEENMLYNQFKQVANIHTYQYFDGDIDQTTYENFLINNLGVSGLGGYTDNDWFQDAQEDADQRHYFHWELEFPKIFFGENEGFDAVVGNPPYITFKMIPDKIRDYYREKYQTFVMKGDIYVLFMELSHNLTRKEGSEGFIIQNKFTKAKYGEKLRKLISEQERIEEIIDFHDSPVFEISAYPMILLRTKVRESQEFKWRNIREDNPADIEEKLFSKGKGWKINQNELGSDKWNIFSTGGPITSETIELGDFANQIGEGVASGARDVFTVDKETVEEQNLEQNFVKPVLRGGDVDKYHINENNLSYLIYPYRNNGGENELVEESEIPNIIDYLREHEEKLRERRNFGSRLVDNGYKWYEFKHAPEGVSNQKILFPDISPESRFAFDEGGDLLCLNTVYYMVRNDDFREYSSYYLISLLNSNFSDYYFNQTAPKVRGGYNRYKTQYVEKFPIPEISQNTPVDKIEELTKKIASKKEDLSAINRNIEDYLGSYTDGKTLNDLYTPASGISDKPVSKTAEDLENLRIGSVETEKDGDSITLLVSARYKPENEAGHETDQYGYTETELYRAMEFHDLSKTEAALIEEFVPVAVDEAGGFADFRESATKTMSLIDRLKKLTLPKVSDVEDDLQKFIEQKEKAEELEEKIEKTDQEINEIVYDLYDLTEEEIEIVEESVNG